MTKTKWYLYTSSTEALDAASNFGERVLGIVRIIPKGKVLTYKQVARLAGSPGATRAVGNIMKNNFDKSVPCHRVIRSDGKLGDYNRGGEIAKRRMLAKEGYIS